MTTTNHVPFVDLVAQHREVEAEVRAGFDQILATGAYIGGPVVAAFEAEFAAYCRSANCIGVANGTEAIELILRGLGIGPGDEVIVPANTFIATAEAVARAGAAVTLVDCDLEHGLIDVELALDAVGPRTAAVIGVDLYGQIAAIDELVAGLANSGVHVVEDAAQSQGATRHGRPIGTDAIAASTSFYPGKNLGAYGDGGAVVTHDDELTARIRSIANHGGSVRYAHDHIGMNSRLDALQAVVLSAKLRRLDHWNAARRDAAARYDEMLAPYPEILRPEVATGNVAIWHLYTVLVEDRDAVIGRLTAAGIGAAIHYPTPIHLTGAFAGLGIDRGRFPNTERRADQMISLPMFPHLTEAQQLAVVEQLVKACR